MTIGQLVEGLTGKVGCELGGFSDCTAFANKGERASTTGKTLQKLGMNPTGTEMFYNGETGEALEAAVFVGPTYYMRLKHMVKDKINYRGKGPRTLLTRQAVQGRANEGGLRIGEMERDSVAAHGATHFLQESMLVRGDQFMMAVCNKTGMIAIYNKEKNLFLSPLADGPIKFVTNLDGSLNVENISVHGRSFSLVKVPYAFKLLIQELATMNIQMRLITSDNINSLDDMQFTHINLGPTDRISTVPDPVPPPPAIPDIPQPSSVPRKPSAPKVEGTDSDMTDLPVLTNEKSINLPTVIQDSSPASQPVTSTVSAQINPPQGRPVVPEPPAIIQVPKKPKLIIMSDSSPKEDEGDIKTIKVETSSLTPK
tara:strand:- start:467 stop:1573 length:1107 start_codon:yes stop_codon:yes gene_type:complete